MAESPRLRSSGGMHYTALEANDRLSWSGPTVLSYQEVKQ
jgi:hypothetical protein